MLLRGASRPDLLRDECLADILAATARRRPEHPALIDGARGGVEMLEARFERVERR